MKPAADSDIRVAIIRTALLWIEYVLPVASRLVAVIDNELEYYTATSRLVERYVFGNGSIPSTISINYLSSTFRFAQPSSCHLYLHDWPLP